VLLRWWFIDEVTTVGEDWSQVIEDLRDNTSPTRDCVVLTGSSSKGFRQAVDSLAGRRGPDSATSDRLLLPMGFRRFCHVTGVDAPADLPSLAPGELFTRRTRKTLVDQGWKGEAQTARANYDRGMLATRRAHDLDDGDIWATPAPAVAWVLDRL
jgi:predicted AAA+ superfamily ATPase